MVTSGRTRRPVSSYPGATSPRESEALEAASPFYNGQAIQHGSRQVFAHPTNPLLGIVRTRAHDQFDAKEYTIALPCEHMLNDKEECRYKCEAWMNAKVALEDTDE